MLQHKSFIDIGRFQTKYADCFKVGDQVIVQEKTAIMVREKTIIMVREKTVDKKDVKDTMYNFKFSDSQDDTAIKQALSALSKVSENIDNSVQKQNKKQS